VGAELQDKRARFLFDRKFAEAARRIAQATARRELEDLRAAINHHRREGLCSAIVEVVLPQKGESRDRWLARSEAAQLIWSAWRYREIQKGQPTGRHSRQHVARFLLAALYTTRRKQALLSAELTPMEGRPWVDLDNGVFYGRPGVAKRTKKRQPAIRIPTRLLAVRTRRGPSRMIHWPRVISRETRRGSSSRHRCTIFFMAAAVV
jgi:hypothetical protein